VLVRSSTTKNRKAGKIYLKSQLAQMLKTITPAEGNECVLAGRIPYMRTMHEHLKAAGITVTNRQGYKVDFHALRMTFSTNLELVGASLQIRQEALRHCDPRLTAGPYTDTTRLETARSIEKLPDFLSAPVDGTQLGTQAPVACSPDVPQAVTANGSLETSELHAIKGECHSASLAVINSQSDQPSGQRGFESPSLRQSLTRGAEIQKTKKCQQ
jgi:hypothetical protein